MIFSASTLGLATISLYFIKQFYINSYFVKEKFNNTSELKLTTLPPNFIDYKLADNSRAELIIAKMAKKAKLFQQNYVAVMAINYKNCHWGLAAVICNKVFIYDSVRSSIPQSFLDKTLNRVAPFPLEYEFVLVPQQKNSYDCGIYTIFFFEQVLAGIKKKNFKKMRKISAEDITAKRLTLYKFCYQYLPKLNGSALLHTQCLHGCSRKGTMMRCNGWRSLEYIHCGEVIRTFHVKCQNIFHLACHNNSGEYSKFCSTNCEKGAGEWQSKVEMLEQMYSDALIKSKTSVFM